jgi:hypothetical protein
LRHVVLLALLCLLWLSLPDVVLAEKPDPVGCEPLTYKLLPGEFNYCLGRRHWENGHFQQAVELLELAASWGSKPAQRLLGVAYFKGEGVAKDRVLGLAWLSLAAERKDRFSLQLYEAAMRTASDVEQRQLQARLAILKPRYADDVTIPRAARRFKRALAQLRSNLAYGAGTCVAGLNASAGDFGNPSADIAQKPTGCSMASEQAIVDAVMVRFEQYFHGLEQGKVIVGPLRTVP